VDDGDRFPAHQVVDQFDADEVVEAVGARLSGERSPDDREGVVGRRVARIRRCRDRRCH